ncbi:MAG: hypothetical protein ACYSW8_27400 [Planctomycetota bacterium]
MSTTTWDGIEISYQMHSDSGPGIDPRPYAEWEVEGIANKAVLCEALNLRPEAGQSEEELLVLAEEHADRNRDDVEDFIFQELADDEDDRW